VVSQPDFLLYYTVLDEAASVCQFMNYL